MNIDTCRFEELDCAFIHLVFGVIQYFQVSRPPDPHVLVTWVKPIRQLARLRKAPPVRFSPPICFTHVTSTWGSHEGKLGTTVVPCSSSNQYEFWTID